MVKHRHYLIHDILPVVAEWVKQLNELSQTPDLILFGAPISRSSISVSGSSMYPNEFRGMWKGFSTYNLDEHVDLSSFQVADAGDVMHTTDIVLSHKRIQTSSAFILSDHTYLYDRWRSIYNCLLYSRH